MKLTLLSHQETTSLVLPEKIVGQYSLRGRNEKGRLIDTVSIEAVRSPDGGESQWIAKSNRRFVITKKDADGNETVVQSAALEPLELYRIQSADKALSFTLFTEPVTADRTQYKGYILNQQNASLTIGRNESNNICYSNKFTSGNHAELVFSNGSAHIKDFGSTNNTYVNDRAVNEAPLAIGDVVYIMGLKIIVTPTKIFINNPDGNVRVNTDALTGFHAPSFQAEQSDDESEEPGTEYFYRAPRFTNEINAREIKIDPPPSNQNNDDMPMVMVIGPSLTMGMASIASGVFSAVSAAERGSVTSAIPSLVMCLSMLLGTLVWPFITKGYQKRLKINKEQKRQKTYTTYLDKLEKIVADETEHQKKLLCSTDYSTAACAERVLSSVPRIWERTPKHSDFLQIGLGIGRVPLKINVQYTERKFALEQDNLTEMMYSFGEKKRFVENVPICLPLTEHFISGIYGEKSSLQSYVRSLILQIVSMHSYDEVKLVLLYDESQAASCSFARWLPHTMNDERTVRYIATNSEEVKSLSADLDSIIEYRKSLSDSKLEDEAPYYVVLCLDKELASKAECVRRVLEHKNNIKFSVVSIFEKLGNLPKECTAVVCVDNGTGTLTRSSKSSVDNIDFRYENAQKLDIQRITNVLANTVVDISGTDFTLPKRYTFFEMLDIGMIEHLNLAENWTANDPTKSLAAVVGIDRYGEPFRLDLHERAHGPHGLVAGMTGSGKSEFIISYILSLAVSFHPYEAAFILIDYKGGGMAKSFENIPHTAGVITNLDGNGIKRSLSSMRSELHRRERIFRDTSAAHNVSNIDIYKYQKLYREGKVSEPLPHLFIISDEFAELKKEQPDFMTELTSTARVGRSLGVHLILATQKPGGVVDDQIRSNSRFKVCLKVQDASDSQEMLGRPDAAALVETGRFYLQVGYDEIFELGQSAWAGAPYYPSQRVIKDRDDGVSVVNINGRVIAEANTNRFAAFVDPPKQLDVITNYIAKYCEAENIKRWKMWLDPIPANIYVDDLAAECGSTAGKFELAPVVGKLDDPSHQSQGVLRVPISAEGNVIVYGSAGSGKAMFVEAMIYSLMREHTPDEVNVYIMDFGSETFTAFAESPFVGDVMLSYETEKINNLIKLMMSRIERRKKLLSQFGGTLAQYNAQAEKTEPNIIVVIDNFAAFYELFEEKLGDINFLAREGTKYGIYFVLTCTGVNNVRLSMLQNFKLMYCLQMNNTDDYSTVVGKTEGLLPEKFKGRGIFRRDKDSVLEFQTAGIFKDEALYQAVRAFCKEQSEIYADKAAAGIPILPERVTQQLLETYVKPGDLSEVPVGIEKNSLAVSYYDFSPVATLALSENRDWINFSGQLAAMLAEKGSVKTIVLSPNGVMNSETELLRFCSDTNSCGQAAYDIIREFLNRNNEYKTLTRSGQQPKAYEPLLVVIHSMEMLENLLAGIEPSGEQKIVEDIQKLKGIYNTLKFVMSKCLAEYNIHFFICENIRSFDSIEKQEWYQIHIREKNLLWVGGGINSQYKLTVNKKPKDFAADISSEFGFVIKDSSAVLVKFLQ